MKSIKNQYVGVIAPAMPHVPAPLFAGVINADRRPLRIRGEVCPLTPSVQFQGTGLPTATPAGVQVMGQGFDKYRTGSHAIGTGG